MSLDSRLMRACACIIFCICFGICTYSVCAQTANFFSLEMAISKTLKHNPQLHQFRFKQTALEAEQKTQSLKPPINVTVEIEDFAGSGSLESFKSATFSLGLSSTIELGGKRASRISVAKNQLNLAQLESQALSLDTLGQVTSLYIQALATQEQIALSREAIEFFELLHQKVLKRVKQGAAPEAEALQVEVELSQEKIKLDALARLLDRQKTKLASFWGSSQPIIDRLSGNIYNIGRVGDFRSLLDKIDHSPNLMVIANQERVKEAEINLAKANNAININWQVGIKQYQDLDEHALVAGLSLPLFTKSRNNGKLSKTLAEKNALDMQSKATATELKVHLFNAFSVYQQNVNAAERLRTEVLPKLEQAMHLTLNAYERGRYRYSELINVQKSWLQAKQQRINNLVQAHHARTNIETLTGQAP